MVVLMMVVMMTMCMMGMAISLRSSSLLPIFTARFVPPEIV